MENAEVQEYVAKEMTKAEELLVQANNLTIYSKADAEGAAGWLQDVKRVTKEMEDYRTSITKPINDSLKKINAMFKGPKDILTRTEAGIKRAMLAWTQAERARIFQEQEAARKKAEAAQRKKEAWAAKAEEKGNVERAEELREQAEEIVPETVSETVYKPDGVYTQKRWKAEVTDLHKLIRAIVEGQVAIDAVVPNQSFLEGLAKRLQGSMKVPGVRFYEDEVVASRSN